MYPCYLPPLEFIFIEYDHTYFSCLQEFPKQRYWYFPCCWPILLLYPAQNFPKLKDDELKACKYKYCFFHLFSCFINENKNCFKLHPSNKKTHELGQKKNPRRAFWREHGAKVVGSICVLVFVVLYVVAFTFAYNHVWR